MRFPNISKQSIQTKMSKLGIKQINESIWTDEEIKILKQYYEIDINKVQDLLPNRSYKSICTKAQRIGIKNREFWSDEEMEKLSELYPNYPIDDILSYFPNRSKYSIIHEAGKLNIQSYDYNPYTREEDDYIINNWKLKPDIILGKELGRTKASIKVRRHFLKLYRRDMDSLTYESLSKYISGNIQYWKNASMNDCDYKCIFTGSKEFQIHHLYGVSNILNDIMDKYNFNIYDNRSVYIMALSSDILQFTFILLVNSIKSLCNGVLSFIIVPSIDNVNSFSFVILYVFSPLFDLAVTSI